MLQEEYIVGLENRIKALEEQVTNLTEYVVGAGNLSGAVLSKRGPRWTDHWCISWQS